MMRFTTFLALVIGSMEIIQPTAAAVLVGLMGRMDLGLVGVNTFQRRQTTGGGIPQVPGQCESVCDPINTIIESTCPPSQCCMASFANGYFECLVCIATTVELTDYTEPQSLIDELYDECASLGFQLPVLTFPGQNSNRTLSSVVPSQTASATINFTSASLITQTTTGPSTSTSPSPSPTAVSQITVTTNAPTPTSSSTSSGLRTETSCFNLIASVMMLGIWFYFAAQ